MKGHCITLLVLLMGAAVITASAAEATKRPAPTLSDGVTQAGSGHTPVFTATLDQLQLERARDRTVYDLMWDANLRAQIESRMAEPAIRDAILGNDAVASLIDIAQVLITGDGSTLTQKGSAKIRLVMAQGTYVDVALDPASTLAAVQLATARTAGGQLIPRTLEEASGHWAEVDGDDLDALARHIQLLGGEVVAKEGAEPGLTCRQGRCQLVQQ